MSQCYPSCEASARPQKDYSRPLHVDCSVEYELPNAAKPPAGTKVEPLLMIHPCYYRRAESQRRSPFINNLPSRGMGSGWRSSQVARSGPSQPPYPVRVVAQAAARAEAVMALLWPDGIQQQQQQQPYAKPVRTKRDPLLCGGGDFSSGSDSGVSAGHWTDSDRSPLAPEIRLQRDFQPGPDSGIATPASLAEDKTALSTRQPIQQQTYQLCSCCKTQVPSYDASKTCDNQYLTPYEQTAPFQPPGLSRYSQTQLQQWLHSVQVSLSPQRKRVAPAPPQMHRPTALLLACNMQREPPHGGMLRENGRPPTALVGSVGLHYRYKKIRRR